MIRTGRERYPAAASAPARTNTANAGNGMPMFSTKLARNTAAPP